MSELIQKNFEEHQSVMKNMIKTSVPSIEAAVEAVVFSIEDGGKILLFGNGGSAADSQHIAAEFTGRFLKERRALPAVALTANTSNLTCLSNDYSYEIIFSRQIEALGCAGDVAFGITTSGNSRNVLAGLKKAKEKGLKTIALTGCGGGTCGDAADVHICVPSEATPRIQEAHIFIYHTICELVEDHFA